MLARRMFLEHSSCKFFRRAKIIYSVDPTVKSLLAQPKWFPVYHSVIEILSG